MPVCSVCEGEASYQLNGSWYCRDCMQAVLSKSAHPVPPREISLLDDKGNLLRLPFCSICHNRIAMVVIGSSAKCRDCFRAKRAWADLPEESEAAPDTPRRPYLGSNIVDFPDEYMCVDVETTGRSPAEDEIIEVAAVHVKGGAVCNTFSSLVRPSCSHVPWTYEEIHELGYDSYDDVPRAVFEDDSRRKLIPGEIANLTKISDDMVRDAPGADEVMPKFFAFVGKHILVGHNALFDMNFLYDACLRCGCILENDYVDTLRIARNLLPQLESHSLANLVQHFKIVQNTAHRAEEDARATVKCLEAMKTMVLQEQTIAEYVKGFVDPPRRHFSQSRKQAYARKHFRPADLVPPDTVDPSHPLCGKKIVFTGELSMDRANAAQMAADKGAVVKTDVSGKTDFLVVGQQDTAMVGSSGISGKEKKAKQFNDSGKGHIRILSEAEFMELIQ